MWYPVLYQARQSGMHLLRAQRYVAVKLFPGYNAAELDTERI